METGVTLFLEEKFQMGMGSRSWRYRQSLRPITDICGVIADPCDIIANPCGVIADPCGVVAIPEAFSGPAVNDAMTPIVARLANHHKTLLNIVKHHETCKPL